MNFKQQDVGEFRIYAVALDAAEGGYVAGVEVRRARSPMGRSDIVFSNEPLSTSRRFDSADAALEHAIERGLRFVQSLQTSRS